MTTLVLDFCKMNFFDNYVICIINEGETVTKEKSTLQTKKILNYYKEQPFVYITHRMHSYSVDSGIYSNTSKIETLAGFVVVSEDLSTIKNAIDEKMFLDKPFAIFEDIDDATLWADNICNMKKKLQ